MLRPLRSRRLILIGLDWVRAKDPPLSLANASIAAACESVADVSTLTLNVNQPALDLHREISHGLSEITARDKEEPLVAVGGYVWAEHLLNDTVSLIKRELSRETNVLLGGPQVTYAPSGNFLASAYPLADGFVRGHGEEPVKRLLMGETKPAGYSCRASFDLGRQSKGGFTATSSPFLSGWMPAQRFIRWETQRGCPFSCSFCQHKDSQDRRIRIDHERVFEECDWLVRQSVDGPLRDLAVVDPTFNSGPTYLEVMSRLAGFTGKISLQCRLEMMTDEFVQAVLELSRTAQVVLEFGVQTIHRNEQRLIERPNNARRIERWIDQLNEEGIPYELSFMYGLPEQTLDSFRRTLEWAQLKCSKHRYGMAVARFFPLMLLRGTKLYHRADELGLVTCDSLNVDVSGRVGSNIPHVVASRTFTFEDWLTMNREAEIVNKIVNCTRRSRPTDRRLLR
jgi:radical SAM superfamily enzyme YgiQ (UPF0313 family)